MNQTQPFFELEKMRGGLRITLGAPFGRTVMALGVLLYIALRGPGAFGPVGQWTATLKAVIQAAKVIIP
jgi:hypothetical protein